MSEPKTISAERFVLVDKDGEARAELALAANGQPELCLSDKCNVPRVTMTLDKAGGPVIYFMDASGNLRAAFGLQSDGRPHFVEWDASGEVIEEQGAEPSPLFFPPMPGSLN